MGVPRWVWVVGVLAAVWLVYDPAGFANFLNTIADSIKTFFGNLG